MAHLSDEEFEGLIGGQAAEPAHLAECPACRQRLAEERAMAVRLRSAFESVHAGTALIERIRSQVRAAGAVPASVRKAPRAVGRGPKLMAMVPSWAWVGLAAAALLVVLAIPLSMTSTTRSVAAAEVELARIHDHNLAPGHQFYSDPAPAALAEYFKKNLGFTPAMPELGHGMKLRGCCVDHFSGAPVGSYVVDTPQGAISVIVVNDAPESFSKAEQIAREGQTLWASSFGHCNMVSIRLNGYTYCAVGDQEVSHDALADLLLRLLSPSN